MNPKDDFACMSEEILLTEASNLIKIPLICEGMFWYSRNMIDMNEST